MNLTPKFLVVFGDDEACATFTTGDGLTGYLRSAEAKYRHKRVINLSKPKRWSEPPEDNNVSEN